MSEEKTHAPQAEVDKKRKLFLDIYDYAELLALAACVILIVFTLLVRVSVVTGESMESTLWEGDRVLLSDLFYTPKQGDIVVIHSPDVDGGIPVIKRVIAVGGQTVEIKRDGVYVYNADGTGGKLEETDGSLGYTVDFSTNLDPNGLYYVYNEGLYQVPEGEIFVLGDHRSISLDSRSFGTVDERAVIGRVLLRVAPLSEFGVP